MTNSARQDLEALIVDIKADVRFLASQLGRLESENEQLKGTMRDLSVGCAHKRKCLCRTDMARDAKACLKRLDKK